jgi:hypothetical protein
MKKILFVLAFAFIGQQAFSQMYIVVLDDGSVGNCSVGEITLSKTNPAGITTHVCIQQKAEFGISDLNQELNSIVNLGYKLIETSYHSSGNGLIAGGSWAEIQEGATFIFAIP